MIARRQVTRLIDRLLTRVAPDLILNRSKNKELNKENQSQNAAESTPARPGQNHGRAANDILNHDKVAAANDSKGRKNLALQLNQVRSQIEHGSGSDAVIDEGSAAAPEPLLEQAPESERSNAFSMPISASEGGDSARQGFNCVQNFAKSGKGAGQNFLTSSDQKSVGQDLDNLDIALEVDNGMGDRQPSDLLISEIREDDNQASSKKDGADDIAEMEKLLKSGGAFGGKGLGDTFKKIRGEIAAQDEQMTGRSGNSSVAKHQLENSAQKSGLESELDMNNMVGVGDGAGEDGDALMMEQSPQSPG